MYLLPCSWRSAIARVGLGSAIAFALLSPVVSAGETPTLVARDAGFEFEINIQREWLFELTKLVDRIKFRSEGPEIRERWPIAGYVADHARDWIWLPFAVSWADSANRADFDPAVRVRAGKYWFPMESCILVRRQGEKVGYEEVGIFTRLQPGRYSVPELNEDRSAPVAYGLAAFRRSRALNPAKIEALEFVAVKPTPEETP